MPLSGEAKTNYMREYMRRRRAGKPEKPVQRPKGAARQAGDSAGLAEARAEIERLREQIAGLKTLAKEARQQGYQDATNAFHKVRGEEQATAEARKARRAAAHDAAKEAMAKVSVEEEKTLIEKLEHAEKLLKARTSEVKNLKVKVRVLSEENPRMTKRLHRQVLGWLHPDRAHGDDAQRKRLERCFQEFGGVKFTFIDEDKR